MRRGEIGSSNADGKSINDHPEEHCQLKSGPIEESPIDSDAIARPKRAETIDIRTAGVIEKNNEDPLSGLIAYFERYIALLA